ncbi:MAG: hypothetical protein IBJ03_11240 [Gemmatimonadaceae bacterium]|nr:hypothetical protein [Gemmatimonadaceae bacterium]
MTNQTNSMPRGGVFVLALVLQVAAQSISGLWGAAAAGLFIGLVIRDRGAFRTGFLAAACATLVLLIAVAVRGEGLMQWANMIGANFSAPGWALLLISILLPALQSGGLAGGVARLLRS